MESHNYRDAVSRCATSVALVTAITDDGSAIGLTISSFASVSLDSRLVLWCIYKDSPNFWDFTCSRYFAISVFSSDQQDLAERFAIPSQGKFDNLSWHPGHGGVPILDNMPVVFECQNRNQYDAGDHIILLCEVENFHCNPASPLVYCGGEYVTIAPAVEIASANTG